MTGRRAVAPIKLEQVCLNSDLRCRYKGLRTQVQNRNRSGADWWLANMEGQPGRFVLFVNRARTMMTLIDGSGFEVTHRFGRPVDLASLKTVFFEAFGLELGIGRTFDQRFTAFVQRKRGSGVTLDPRATWTWLPKK